jgi:hypothetical protein
MQIVLLIGRETTTGGDVVDAGGQVGGLQVLVGHPAMENPLELLPQAVVFVRQGERGIEIGVAQFSVNGLAHFSDCYD